MELMRPMKLGGEQLMFGADALFHLERIKGKRAFIVISGPLFRENGLTKRIEGHLAKAGIESILYEDVVPDPPFEVVTAGAQRMAETGPDMIIGLGGGSALDAAKAMWVLYEHPELDTIDKFVACHNRMPPLRKKAIMVAIPTTSGTASEASRSVVITDTKTNQKVGVSDMQLVPDIAILDPALTLSMPRSLTAETGMDALTHAIEAYLSNRANFISDIFAKKSAELILAHMVDAYEYPDSFDARNGMQLGSYLAGIAFNNVSLGIAHSISHAIGGAFHLPHGYLNAIALPHVIDFNRKDAQVEQRLAALEKELDLDCDLASRIRAINKKIGIKPLAQKLNDVGRFASIVGELAKTAQADGCTKTSPRAADASAIEQIIRDIFREEE